MATIATLCFSMLLGTMLHTWPVLAVMRCALLVGTWLAIRESGQSGLRLSLLTATLS
jgi:hypothetical protein